MERCKMDRHDKARNRKRWLAGIIAASAIALGLFALSDSSAGATTNSVERPAATAHAYLIKGWVDTNGWCLAAAFHVEDGQGVAIAQCQNTSYQVWECGRYGNSGFCSPILAKEPLDIGQRGRYNLARMINPHKNGSVNFVIYFAQVKGNNNWVLGLPSYHPGSRAVALAYPNTRNKGHIYWLRWLPGTRGYSYVWHFTGRWYEVR
jgi:hypothetical protein